MDTTITASERLSVLLKAGEKSGYIKDAETIWTVPELVANAFIICADVLSKALRAVPENSSARVKKICCMTMAFCAYAGIGGAAMCLKNKLPNVKSLVDILCETNGFSKMDEEACRCAGIACHSYEYNAIAEHINTLAYDEFVFMRTIDNRTQLNECFEAFFYYGIALIIDPVGHTSGLSNSKNEPNAKAVELCKKGDEAARNSFFEAAIEYYRAALITDPKHTAALDSLGAVYAVQNKYKKANDAFDKALAIDGNDIRAIHGKILLLRKQGKTAEALSMCNKALSKKYSHRIDELKKDLDDNYYIRSLLYETIAAENFARARRTENHESVQAQRWEYTPAMAVEAEKALRKELKKCKNYEEIAELKRKYYPEIIKALYETRYEYAGSDKKTRYRGMTEEDIKLLYEIREKYSIKAEEKYFFYIDGVMC